MAAPARPCGPRCLSVRCHNRRHGTAVREDVRFMQVKFGCARTQKYSKKRKQQPSLCPAYFVLQYEEDIDQLVISELNSDHVHADLVFSLARATAAMASTVACDGPATKLRKQQEAGGTDSDATAGEDSHAVTGQLVDGALAPYRAPMLPEAAKENGSASALVRVAEVMKTFLRLDRGSLASISADGDHGLDRLSFQTGKMKSSFMQFPESLLLHRVPSEAGHVLYAFLVESQERAGRVVHLSLLKDDTGHGIRKMLTVFKEFNPEWQKVQAVFVDVSFFHKAILHEFFPSAQVLLSVYHTVRLLEKNVKEAEISSSVKQNLTLALQRAVFSPSAASLDALSQLAKCVVSPELYNCLQANWFSCELLWRMHTEKGLRCCSTHMDSLDLITQQISCLLGQQPSLEASILRFLECADYLDSRDLESLNWGVSGSEEAGRSSLQEKPDVRAGAAVEPGPISGFLALTEHPKPAGQAAAAGPGCMLATLRESCTELGSWLCLKEWEVVQASTQLLSPAPGSLAIRLLEDAHWVSRDCRSCSCCLPRRHPLPPPPLLLHRAGGPAGRALYVFLVAGPAPALRGGMARVVHFAVPRDESAGGLSRMYGVFRAFNPAWAETRLLLVGPGLPQPPALAQAFPAAEVQLSVFHLCKRLQRRVQRLALEGRAERLILASLRDAMCAATESRRRKMHALLRDLVTPDLLPQLHIHWLLDEEIWATHRERSWGESSSYFRDLEIVTQGLSQVFSTGLSLESCITSLAQHYQKCVSKSPPDAVMCSVPHPDHCAARAAPQSLPASGPPPTPVLCQGTPSQSSVQASPTMSPPAAPRLPAALQHQPEIPQALLQSKPSSPQSSLDPSSPAAELEATENPESDSEEEINRRSEEHIKQSLSDICTEAAARLCLSEFAVVQKSVQLIGSGEDALSVQVLEDAHRVDLKGLSSCTCYFNQVFQLPCRHILAVLNSDRKTVQPEMLGRQWQKGCDAHQAGGNCADGLLEVLKSSWNASLDKSLVVSFLTAEVSRLLTRCSGEEFECRYRTLRELADSWIGPYVEVKL
ncbi:PREDICTED: zinc finger SWIM domain-containing protein 3 [Nipponia nippon]|uniref:zinc finger SWIM domain-containing protein 3 n=1 Tax=Nipponia nippon TaxID=128390 RepID=UPI0005116887|nr:PREDICTED: zinc finger SWIM domain-containing protein 3 [Nipponia nippon]